MPEAQPFIFLGGHRKGGTTLLASLLDGHPQLWVYPEDITVLYAYFPVFCQGDYSDEERRRRLDKVIFQQFYQLRRTRSYLEAVRVEPMREVFFDLLRGRDLADMGQVLEALARAFQAVHPGPGPDARGMVLKETSIEIYAEMLFDKFPAAKFVHLLRDPRDNFAALKAGVENYYSAFDDDANTILASLLHRYGLGMRLARFNQERFGPGRYLVTRHEDVVKDSEAELARISEFLGIDFQPCLLQPTIMGRPSKGNNLDGLEMDGICDINIGRWPQRITPAEAQVIEFHFGELMESWGYRCRYSRQEQARAACEFYKWSNYRYFYFDRF